jgi:hypothetical protein
MVWQKAGMLTDKKAIKNICFIKMFKLKYKEE